MKNLIATLLATALAAACGGSGAPTGIRDHVSFDFYSALPAPAQAVNIEIYTDAGGATPYAGSPFVIPTCTTVIKTACWDAAASKFNAWSVNLPGAVAPGTPYWFTVKFFQDAGRTVSAGIIALKQVNVISGQVNSLSINSAVVEAVAAPGVLLATFSATPATVLVGTTSQLVATAVDPSAVPGTPAYAWTLGTGASNPGCTGSTLSDATITNPVFTAGTTVGNCTATVTATVAGVAPVTQSLKLTVANDASVSVGGVPAPVITAITFGTTNVLDTACSFTKPAGGWAGAVTTCPIDFALAATPLNAVDRFASHGYFGNIGVTYDVTVPGVNLAAQPAVSATVGCTNALVEYPLTGTPAAPKTKTVGFNPGGATAAANILATDGWWAEPGFTATVPAFFDETATYLTGNYVLFDGARYISLVDANLGNDPETSPAAWALAPFTAADYTANFSGQVLCTFKVTVTNEGGSDTVPFYALFQ